MNLKEKVTIEKSQKITKQQLKILKYQFQSLSQL